MGRRWWSALIFIAGCDQACSGDVPDLVGERLSGPYYYRRGFNDFRPLRRHLPASGF